MAEPLVSVILPVYNREGWVARAIESVVRGVQRAHDPQLDRQIAVVVGRPSATGGLAQQHLWYLRSSREYQASGPARNRQRPDAAQADPAATLVLRAIKSDVDALAAGKLTADQFAPKVQILWSGAPSQPSEAAPPQPPVPAAAPR